MIESFYTTISSALATRDLLVFDQRGTGVSGLLRCRDLERRPIGDRIKAVNGCATQLGAARAFYTSRDSADDIEAVRAAAGVDKVVPYGTSYGTKVALVYAQRYPQRTERLVLDSLVDLDGPDPFSRDTFQAIPRILRELCGRTACIGITPDPVGDLAGARQAARAAAAARGHRGRRREAAGARVGADRDLRRPARGGRRSVPAGRVPCRGALRAWRGRGTDAAARAEGSGQRLLPRPRCRTSAPRLYTATTCEEGPLPWEPALSFGDRWKRVFSLAGTFPDSAFSPFDRGLARANDTLRLCAPWPTSGPLIPPDLALPDVPTLILGGAADLRTPVENIQRLATRLPHASTVVVPYAGHSVLDSDLSGCADDATRLFFAGKPVPPVCSVASRRVQDLLGAFFTPTPIAPRSVAQLGTPRRVPGRPGRTVRAVELTFFDAILSLVGSSFGGGERVIRIGGLRGGRLVARMRPKAKLRLDRYSYVPGVWVSGRLGDLSAGRLRLRVGGRRAARGRVTLPPVAVT